MAKQLIQIIIAGTQVVISFFSQKIVFDVFSVVEA